MQPEQVTVPGTGLLAGPPELFGAVGVGIRARAAVKPLGQQRRAFLAMAQA